MLDLVIVGAGGFGREVADIVVAINDVEPTWNLLGFVDDSPSDENLARVERRGSSLLGPIEAAPSGAWYVVGIGDGATRARVSQRLGEAGLVPATLVHPSASLGASLTIGGGSIIASHVDIGSDATIGSHVHLDRAVQIGHDSELGDFVTVHPAAVVSGACVVAENVEIGTHATVLQGLFIGQSSTIGAAACVVEHVESATTVIGVPARELNFAKQRRDSTAE